jgi:hypothetical protein
MKYNIQERVFLVKKNLRIEEYFDGSDSLEVEFQNKNSSK